MSDVVAPGTAHLQATCYPYPCIPLLYKLITSTPFLGKLKVKIIEKKVFNIYTFVAQPF